MKQQNSSPNKLDKFIAGGESQPVDREAAAKITRWLALADRILASDSDNGG